MSKKLLMILVTTSLLTGCASMMEKKTIENYEEVLRDNSHTVFNPQALYIIPPEGVWVPDLIVRATGERTGPIYVYPSSIVGFNPDLVGE